MSHFNSTRARSIALEIAAIDAAMIAEASALEREFAQDLLPWRVAALVIFVSAIFSWVAVYGVFALAYSLAIA